MTDVQAHHAHLVAFISNRVLARDTEKWLAVSLTFKQALPRANCTLEKIDHDQLSRTVGEILKRVNRWAFGSAYRRHRKRVAVVSAMEWSRSKRLHVHMLLQVPSHLAAEWQELVKQVKLAWQQMRWAHRQCDIKLLQTPRAIETWTKYILKEVLNSEDALDHRNLHI